MTTLVILAAGLGSRFGGNKQISEVGPHGEILMEYSIHDAIKAGFDQIVFILKEEMVEGIKSGIGARIPSHVRVDYAVQSMKDLPAWYELPAERTKPFGTVHAVLAARKVIAGPFATINADDFYGAKSFEIMHKMLVNLADATTAGMVPYILGNTMSENGGVTRGVCRLENGMLRAVTETHDIHYGEGREILSDAGVLSPDAMVSMNMWGFHQSILPVMEQYFVDFLKGLTPENIKAECLLPVMVGDFLENGSLTVKAEHSPDRWFGITYREDRDTVAAELAALHQNGTYPQQLM